MFELARFRETTVKDYAYGDSFRSGRGQSNGLKRRQNTLRKPLLASGNYKRKLKAREVNLRRQQDDPFLVCRSVSLLTFSSQRGDGLECDL